MKLKLQLLTISIGIIYILFGFLKFFPNVSPAESIGADTVYAITGGVISYKTGYFLLALLEVVIGLALVSGKFLKWAILAALAHMICTFVPFMMFPDLTLNSEVLAPTLLGQYILKNVILVFALIVIYPTKMDCPVRQKLENS